MILNHEYYIEWSFWLVLWLVVCICAILQHAAIPDEMKLSKFSFIYESQSRRTLYYATLVKVAGICLSYPDFEILYDPKRVGLLTCNAVCQVLTFWAIYQTMNKFSQEQYWLSLEQSSMDSSQTMGVLYRTFNRIIRRNLQIAIVIVLVVHVITSFWPYLLVYMFLLLSLMLVPFCFYKMVKFMKTATNTIEGNYRMVKKMNRGVISRYQRMKPAQKKKFLKANTVGKQLAHFKRTMNKLRKLIKTCKTLLILYAFTYSLAILQVTGEFISNGITAEAQIAQNIDQERYTFILSLQTSRFQTLIAMLPLLYYHWIKISWRRLCKMDDDPDSSEAEQSISAMSRESSAVHENEVKMPDNPADEVSDISISHMSTSQAEHNTLQDEKIQEQVSQTATCN